MPSLSKLKQSLINSRALPAVYTAVTKPFARRFRHLQNLPPVPTTPKKVSVVVPNYNYADHLEARLGSILTQTYPLHELIILDDASTDNSISVINTLLDLARIEYPDLKIKFFPNQQNSGKSINQWQRAFKEASGDFLWLAEADDLSDPNFLATAMAQFENERVILSYTNSVAINAAGKVLTYDFQNHSVDKQKSGHWQTNFVENGEQEIKQFFAINCNIPNVSACIFRLNPKVPYHKYLESAKSFAQCGDWYFYLQVLKHGSVAYSRPALNYFRLHQRSVTSNSKKSTKLLEEIKTVHALVTKNYDLPKSTLAAMKREETRIKERNN